MLFYYQNATYTLVQATGLSKGANSTVKLAELHDQTQTINVARDVALAAPGESMPDHENLRYEECEDFNIALDLVRYDNTQVVYEIAIEWNNGMAVDYATYPTMDKAMRYFEKEAV